MGLVQHLPDDRDHPIDLGTNDGKMSLPAQGITCMSEHLQMTGERIQRVAQFMGHRRGQFAQSRKALPALNLYPRFDQFKVCLLQLSFSFHDSSLQCLVETLDFP